MEPNNDYQREEVWKSISCFFGQTHEKCIMTRIFIKLQKMMHKGFIFLSNFSKF